MALHLYSVSTLWYLLLHLLRAWGASFSAFVTLPFAFVLTPQGLVALLLTLVALVFSVPRMAEASARMATLETSIAGSGTASLGAFAEITRDFGSHNFLRMILAL